MGRHRVVHTCCIEETVWLDIRLLRAWGFLEAGALTRGVVNWRMRGVDLRPAQIATDLRSLRALRVTVVWRGIGGFLETQSITIERTPCRFGGWRYYFVCPRLGRRCEVMPLLDGEFASREAHAITYASQSEGELDRAYRRRDKLRSRLDGANGLTSPTGVKRERLAGKWHEAARKARALRSEALRRRFGMA
ncbi:MAG: hypothetical protein ABL871_11375 [Terricaulis sp.]